MASKDGSTFFFTSESVNEGHPDKLADQVRGATPRFRPAPAPTARRLLQGKKLVFLPLNRPRTKNLGPRRSRPENARGATRAPRGPTFPSIANEPN